MVSLLQCYKYWWLHRPAHPYNYQLIATHPEPRYSCKLESSKMTSFNTIYTSGLETPKNASIHLHYTLMQSINWDLGQKRKITCWNRAGKCPISFSPSCLYPFKVAAVHLAAIGVFNDIENIFSKLQTIRSKSLLLCFMKLLSNGWYKLTCLPEIPIDPSPATTIWFYMWSTTSPSVF